MSEISQKPPVPFKRIKSEDYDDGQVVMTISGTITSIYEPKKGDTYEYQNGKIKDSEGTEIEFCFSKNTQPLTAKGKKITVRSVKSEQHGWNGIKVEDSTFTPKGQDDPVTKRLLKITATADVTYEGSAPSGKSSQPASTGTKGGGSTSNQTTSPAIHPQVFLLNTAALHKACHDAAIGVYGGSDTPDLDLIRTSTASLFIEACRNGYAHDFLEQISKPVPPKILPAPKDPALWKQCMLPKGEFAGQTLDKVPDEKIMDLYAFYEESPKGFATDLAKCIEQAAKDRKLIKEPEPPQQEQQSEAPLDDDVPF